MNVAIKSTVLLCFYYSEQMLNKPELCRPARHFTA